MSDWEQMLKKMVQNELQKQIISSIQSHSSQPSQNPPNNLILSKPPPSMQPLPISKKQPQKVEAPFIRLQRIRQQIPRNQQDMNNQSHRNQSEHSNFNNKNERQIQRQYKTKQIEYVNHCFPLLKNYEKVDQKGDELSYQIRQLRKFLLTTDIIQSYHQKPTQVTLYRSLDHPILFIGYVYNKQKRYMRIREIQKYMRSKLFQFHQIIKKICNMYFMPVDTQYEEALTNFAEIKAKQVRIKLNKEKKFFQADQQIQPLFYYCLNQAKTSIQFVYFDVNMNEISFGQQFVKQAQNKAPESFQIFKKFISSARGENNVDLIGIGEQEIESDQQENSNTHYQKDQLKHRQIKKEDLIKEINQTQSRLKTILSKNLTKLQEHLEEITQHLMLITKNDYHDNQKAAKLQQEVDILNRNLQNFKQVKESVQQKLSEIRRVDEKEKLQILKISLKRMILAQKHLESKLPILTKKHQIFERLDKNNLIIIQGETGSGKSTQLPQLLCQYYKLFQNPKSKPVLVTQPRKIATRSLAERVAEQMQQKVGYFVDYAASSTTQVNPDAKIIFKLDRLVLDQLVVSPTLDNYSCLVIDEAHERTISIDVILGLTKQLLKKRQDFKVIVTSASMQIAKFEQYFKAKTLKVSGRQYPVQIKYQPSKQDDTVIKVQRLIQSQLLTYNKHLKDQYKGHILVFCTDTGQINRLVQYFSNILNRNLFMVLPLHGRLQPQQQKRVFLKTKENKLIFATRIAQTAITIDGVKVVIDPGYDRQLEYDQNTKFSSMKLKQISQSSAKQRAGRAGRTQSGYCFRLYTKPQFDNRPKNKKPQIQNMALDTLVLRLKALHIKNIFEFQYIQKPNQQGMVQSLQLLKLIGCLDENQSITSIGQFLVKIPIEPFLARSIIESLIMEKTIQTYPKFYDLKKQYTKSIIQILCMILNVNNLFRANQTERQKLEKIKYKKFSHQMGDFFFLKNIYQQYLIQYEQRDTFKYWLRDHYLIGKTLQQIKQLVFEIHQIAKQFNIDENQMQKQIMKCKRKLELYKKEQQLILSCLTTSFCSNICLFSGHSLIGYTYLSQKKTIQIYGTSCLSLLGITPKWIVVYDLYSSKDKLYCRVANAIDFKFIKDTVNPYVFNKFNLAQAQNSNPFYKQLNFKQPSLIFSKIKQKCEKRSDQKFFNEFNLSFNQSLNTITAFIMYSQNQQNKIEQDKNKLQQYIQKLHTQAKNPYLHNFVGNIYVKLTNGFQIENIEFDYNITVFEITKMDKNVYQCFVIDWQGAGRIEAYGRQKIRIYTEDHSQISQIQEFLQFLKSKQMKFDVKKQLVDSRRKIPQTKIYLHWWAGNTQRRMALLGYPYKQQYVPTQNGGYQRKMMPTAPYNLRHLQQVAHNLNGQNNQRQRQRGRRYRQKKSKNAFGNPRLTKKGNCINLLDTDMDEIQIHRQLLKLITNNKISIEFSMPEYIKKFRDPQISQSSKSDQVWIKQIKQLISGHTNKIQNCIRVWGRKYIPPQRQTRGRNKRRQISQLENSLRIQMHAEIKTFDFKLLNKLINQYEGKKFILGCQKIHINSMFDQIIAVVDPRAFNSLKDQYEYQKENFQREYQTIQFDVVQRRNKRSQDSFKYMIVVRSQNRQDLIQPIRVLSELFTPKYIVIQDREYRFLDNVQGGQKILNWVEQDFGWKIYFGFDRYQRKIKLYCHDSIAKDVQSRLRYYLAQNKQYNQLISYRGKNLKRIQKLLKQRQQEIRRKNQKNKSLCHQIIFSSRKIFISGDYQTLQWAKKQIQQSQNQQKNKNQCQICNDIMAAPYELYNCGHSFCWACLASLIRQYKHESQTKLLKCSYIHQDTQSICSKLININDVAMILSQPQLQRIADIKIGKFVQQNKDKYVQCFSTNCEQIFQLNQLQTQNYINCQLCGKSYCLICKQGHKQDISCSQWQNRNNLTSQNQQKLGIKECPKCQKKLYKAGGCNHITCRCGAHICWKCLKYFDTSDKCYDHLAKVCGGIFDPQGRADYE